MSDEYIQKIRLTNVRCLRGETEINFGRKPAGEGQLIEIIGDNATGKSTIHDMILKIWDGGSDPGIISMGATEASGTMLFADGTLAVRTQTATKSELTIVGPDGMAKKAPATYLKDFGSWFSRDPLAFDDASPKDRLKILLEISPVRFERTEIEAAIGRDVAKLTPVPADVLDLQGFGKFVASVTERRALIGSQRDEKSSSVEALRKTLPQDEEDGTPKNWAAELERIDGRLFGIDRKETTDITTIAEAAAGKRDELRRAIQKAEDATTTHFAQLMSCARSGKIPDTCLTELPDHSCLVDLLMDLAGLYQKHAVLHDLEVESIQQAKATASREREAIASIRGEAQAGRDQQLKAAGVLEIIAKDQAAAIRLTAQYDALQAAAKALEKLRKAKVDGALMPGLEVREDGSIWMNGIDWDSQNSATRIMKSVELCSRGTGERWDGFMACDGGERLGPARKEEFRQAVEASGMQALLFTVASKEWIAEHGREIQSVPSGALKVEAR